MHIKIKKVEDCMYHKVIEIIQSDADLKEIFQFNCFTRVGFSPLTYFILADEKKVGFIALIDEEKSFNIDMGLINGYKNKKIGTEAMKLFLSEIKKFNIRIIVETKVNNYCANKLLQHSNFVLIKTKKMINYYEFTEEINKKILKKTNI